MFYVHMMASLLFMKIQVLKCRSRSRNAIEFPWYIWKRQPINWGCSLHPATLTTTLDQICSSFSECGHNRKKSFLIHQFHDPFGPFESFFFSVATGHTQMASDHTQIRFEGGIALILSVATLKKILRHLLVCLRKNSIHCIHPGTGYCSYELYRTR